MPTVPEGSLMQLSAAEARSFAGMAAERNPGFRKLRDAFVAQGFKFLEERVKVFVYSAASEQGIAASTFAIFPSLVAAKPSDPFHIAVGIAVHQSGGVIATSVKVGHNPFRVVEFTLHEFQGRRIQARTISAADLASLDVAEAARRLGPPKLPARRARTAPVAHPMAEPQVEKIVATAFDQIIHDKFASRLYSPAAMRSLLRQRPLYVKLARVNQARYADAGVGRLGLACSCTCCNGCTTTSITIGDISISL